VRRRFEGAEARRPGFRGVGGASLFSLVLALSATRPVFTADLYVIDGGSGKMRAAADHNDVAHWLDQSNTTLQCALPAGHADFGGKLCLTFAGAEWYQSNQIAKWPFLSDGTGCEISFAFTNTTVAAGNRIYLTTRTTGRGFTISQGGANANSNGAVAAGTAFLALNGFRSGMVVAVPYVFQYRHGTAETPDATAKVTGAVAATANYSASPEAGNPEYGMVFGALSNGTLLIQGRLRSFHSAPVLSAAGRATRDAWYLQDTGIAA
jgi:hypothetical protein